jgi:hypothetical protein
MNPSQRDRMLGAMIVLAVPAALAGGLGGWRAILGFGCGIFAAFAASLFSGD